MDVVVENDYKVSIKTGVTGQIPFTNATTRTVKYREMVVAADANGNAFIGYVATPGGIATTKSGMIDLYEGQEVATNQFTAGAFVVGDSNVYITPQTNGSQALITQASAVGDFTLKALIMAYDAAGTIRLRMPTQDGNLIAAT